MAECKSFAPLYDETSRVLILGSMPSIASLTAQQYYAHPRNRFWQLLAALYDEPLPCDYAAKLALLRRRHLALWDTLLTVSAQAALIAALPRKVLTIFLA